MTIDGRPDGRVANRSLRGMVRSAQHKISTIAHPARGIDGSTIRSPLSSIGLLPDDDGTEDDQVTVDPDRLASYLAIAADQGGRLDETVEERTTDIDESIDEDAFFSEDGRTTLTNRYDLEKAVPDWHKHHFREVERYWVNKPYSFVIIFHAQRENELKYYLVEPYLSPHEAELLDFLTDKLRSSLDYGQGVHPTEGERERKRVIERATRNLLERYGLCRSTSSGLTTNGVFERMTALSGDNGANETAQSLDSPSARPEPAILDESAPSVSEYQIRKLLYYLKRDFVGYERIDGIKHDVNVEDISCDGYDSPVFVYHTDHENLITNVSHGRDELDDFVIKLAQRSGKAISKRQPQVDATLPDGSRAQLTLGREVSDHGTNYTIRQFRDVPFTPVDLINWRTFSLDQMAHFWLAIENGRSILFAGGTASGKTTSLNAMSLFIPSNTKIISIEDTREVALPHRNWVASVTRPTLSGNDSSDIDEFDLLEAGLRQRPDYIVVGEVRGEEGRTLFQIMSTGHTTYTTFHAGSVNEVVKRFTNEPINVSKTLFTAVDMISVQSQFRIRNRKVRRNKSIAEVTEYDPETDEIHTNDVYSWNSQTDAFDKVGTSTVLSEVAADSGWDQDELEEELFRRRVVLAYLVENEINTYPQVAATIQAFISDPELTLALIANGRLVEHLGNLRQIENVDIDVDPETEELIPRPEPDADTLEQAAAVLGDAEANLFDRYRDEEFDIDSRFTAISPVDEYIATEEASPNTSIGQLIGGD